MVLMVLMMVLMVVWAVHGGGDVDVGKDIASGCVVIIVVI